ncbi:ABC transporter substrate-binding protein [Hydrogenophaga sp. 5NK40-0174]|uniref:ABC transporter substrate-binding protein n=1 Tax=Hydrogenophaga sp. 5NK40-0174 TaxID=3127649 RepID=UPI003104DC09
MTDQTQPPGWTRRHALISAAATGAAAACPTLSAAAEIDVIKVTWVSPQTGPLAPFGVSDRYVSQALAPMLSAGVPAPDGRQRRIELTLVDAASSPPRAAQLAQEAIAAGAHLVVATATPEMCNPVADVCEAAAMPCVTANAPWQAWYYGRGATPTKGFDWTFHFFCGLEDFADVYSSLLAKARLGKTVGGLYGNDLDADAFLKAFPGAFDKKGLSLSVPYRVDLAQPDWSALALQFKRDGVRMVTGVLPPPAAIAFFDAARKVDYQPAMASIAKAFVFPETAAQVHRPGLTLTNEVWWSPAWPFRSTLTGQKAEQVAQEYEEKTGKPWVQALGFSHALVDVAAAIFRETPSTSREDVRQTIERLRVHTVVGPVNWRDRHPNRNVCTTPAVGGQWQRNDKGRWILEVVDNSRYLMIPVTSPLQVAT